MRMYQSVAVLVAAILWSIAISSQAAVRVYHADITHEQEVSNPPIPDEGSSGRGVFILNDNNPISPRLHYFVKLTGLDLDTLQTPGNANDNVTRTHFHRAPAGTNGGVVFGQIDPNPALRNDLDDLAVDPATGWIRGIWDNVEGNGTTLAAQIAGGAFDVDANALTQIYFNVHTADHGGGEIRGQLSLVPEPTTVALGLLGLAPLWAMRHRK